MKKLEIKKTCFIITPIGDVSSEIRRKADGLIRSVIKPVLEKEKFEAIIPHEISTSGPIGNDIINNIINSNLCIANLTGLNPNVMYELAVRHAANKPIVCIAERGTILPFDLTTERVLFYSNDMCGVAELKEELPKYVESAMDTKIVQLNPITNACKDFVIEKVKTTSDNVTIDRLEVLVTRLSSILGNNYSPKNTYRKVRDDNSTTYYICTEDEAKIYNLEKRGYIKIVVNTQHLDGE